jgi:hypothetical protein
VSLPTAAATNCNASSTIHIHIRIFVVLGFMSKGLGDDDL